jgi:uncharacterized protein YceH (UPF0502 family)
VSRTRKLDPVEIRVLGVLLEKEQTTPEHYPLTTLGVVGGCNQKTNREPVTELTETEVTEALDRLREDVLVWRSQTTRAERWEHRLDRRWGLDKKAKAVMTLLLLRGPQTPGELRTRSERLYPFASVAEVEETLRRLAEGFDALVAELPRRPGQREQRWTHLEGAGGDLGELAAAERAEPAPGAGATEGAAGAPVEAGAPGAPIGRRTPYDERLEALETALGELRGTLETLRDELREVRAGLGLE